MCLEVVETPHLFPTQSRIFHGQAQKLEVELDKTTEELNVITEKLKEKDESLNTAELEVGNIPVNSRCHLKTINIPT